MNDLKKYIDKFSSKKIVIVGDLMLDKYINGKVDRISPEAPVPIVSIESEKYIAGGAANAANNVTSLGGKSYLFGIVGNDHAKDILIEKIKEIKIDTIGVLIDEHRPTIQKIRVIGQNQQIVRIDYEDKKHISGNFSDKILEAIRKIGNIDAILVSDYAKGAITKKLMDGLKKHSKDEGIFLIVDPRPSNKSMYKGISVITPNKKESEQISGVLIETKDDMELAGKKIMDELDCKVLMTLGERGMALFEKDKETIYIPTVAKEVYDVTGAGDTVISVVTLCLASGADLHESAVIANTAAGMVVEKLGPATVTIEELKNKLDER